MTSPARRREAVEQAQEVFEVSERRACRAIEQPRSTQRYTPLIPDDEAPLTAQIVHLTTRYGRYGYRRITALLQNEGWQVNHKRVERIWRLEGLKVPPKQPKRGRLWLNDGSCLRLRPEYPNHVWSYDFMLETTRDGRPFRLLNIIDEYTRECLNIRIGRHLKTEDVQECLTELFCSRGIPRHIRSDNGAEFTAKSIRAWLNELGANTLFIEPGSPSRRTSGRCGRMAISRASTASYVTSCSTGRSFTPWRKPRSSSKAGEESTIGSDPTAP